MLKRPLTQSQRDWLLDEMRSWQASGLVTDQQAHGILDLYELPAESAARKRSIAIFILMGAAAFLVGLAALLLIGYNWDAMPDALKLVCVFGIIFGLHGVGFWLRYVKRALGASEIVFFLACFGFGTGIWLIAQIFNINSHYPDGFWWWALGVLPFALCLDTLLLHTLLVALLAIWVGTEMIGFGGDLLFGRWWGFVPKGCYTLPLFALPGLLWAYRQQRPLTVGLYVPLVAWWLILQPLAWHWQENMVFFIGSVGAMMMLAAECHPEGSRFAIPYRAYGVLVTFGVLIPLSNVDFYRQVWDLETHRTYLAPLVLFVLAAGATLLFVNWQRRKMAGAVLARSSLAALLYRQAVPLGLMFLMSFASLWVSALGGDGTDLTEVPLAVLANLAMLAAAFWLMTLGLREDRGVPFAGGVAYFLLWTVLRYIDLFGGAGGMLGAAFMFFLCGAALFGVALYWRRRKELRHG